MMSTLFSEALNPAFDAPFTSFSYRDISSPANSIAEETMGENAQDQEGAQQGATNLSVQEVTDAINHARSEAVAETEKRLRQTYEARSTAEADKILRALELFQDERKSYFSRVESDVVHLALAIAAKILHHEVQVDPLLVATMVRVAVDKMNDVSSVSVRVAPVKAGKWREHLASLQKGSTIAVVEDVGLGIEDCILETDLGSANFGIDAQLKEVEQGFFDLLAQRPPVK
jgi:flagellar assembly protein FliH